MKDVVEAVAEIVKANTGFEISREYLPYIIVALAIGPFAMWLYLSIRRWRGDFRAISGEMEAAVQVISHETRSELNGLYKKFSGLHEDLKGTMVGRFDALQVYLRPTVELEGAADESVAADEATTRTTRQTRLSMAEQVRSAVVAKWMEGRPLEQIAMNVFQYVGTTEAGLAIRIYFQTPYRPTIGTDGRLPFTLEVWVDGYKHMNFEWDSDGGYALRGFKKGDWIEDVVQWQFLVGQSQQAAA